MQDISHPLAWGEHAVNRSSHRHASSFLKKSCLSVLVSVALCGGHAVAQAPDASVQYSVPAGDLIQVVNEISRSSGMQIVYDIELLRGKRAVAVSGAMTVAQAMDRALVGSGLQWERVSPTTISIGPKASPAKPKTDERGAASSRERQGSPRGEVTELEDVVVVGSRLGSSPVESAMPIKVITRDDIDRSGAGSVAQMLSYLPEIPINNGEDRQITGQTSMPSGGNTNSTTVQMRGMPHGTTLVLINGRRAGDSAAFSQNGFFDLSTIPLALVERIEVLPAGASAVYGGDALAGVINIVLRKDVSGLELRMRQAAADGYGNRQASFVWGKAWAKGGMNIAGSWNKGTGLWSDERSLTSDMDFRRYGGADLRGGVGNPFNFYSLEGCPLSQFNCAVPLEERGNLPGLDSPVASVPEGSDGIGLTPSDLVPIRGKVNPRRHLRSEEKRYGVNFDGRLELLPNLEAFAELTYTRAEVPAFQMPLSSVWSGEGGKRALLAAGNPLNPFGVEVGVDFYHKNTGLYRSFLNKHTRGLLGLRGTLGRFDWEMTGWTSRDASESRGAAGFDLNKIYAALADPASGFNPMVSDGSAPATTEVMESLVSARRANDMSSRIRGWNTFARGSLMQLPAGEMTALLGMESQTFTIYYDSNDSAVLIPFVHGSSTNRAAFAEARVPILSAGEGQGLERLAMTAALRRESSDRFQSNALTKSVGVEYRPWKTLLLRSTYSTAFRPIITHNAVQNPYELQTYVQDPKLNNQLYPIQLVQLGGAPADLMPETSRTITMGAVYRPTADWSLSVTHWSIQFEDEIRLIGPLAMLENEAIYTHRIIRNPVTGQIEVIDARSVNISMKKTSGVDVAIEGGWSTPFGDFHPAVAATYTYQFEQQLSDTSPIASTLAKYNSTGWAPPWKIIPRLAWDYRGQVRAMLVGRYVSAYDDTAPFMNGPQAGTSQRLGDFWMFDLNTDFSLGRIFKNQRILYDTKFSIGATNLFNRLPDFCNACGFPGYDTSQYDIMGRTVYAEIRMNF